LRSAEERWAAARRSAPKLETEDK